MNRDFEKAKRQDKARARRQYDPIASFRPSKSRGSEFRARPSRRPTIMWCVVTKDGVQSKACWKKFGSGDWRCTQADRPLHWMVELPPEKALELISNLGAHYRWVRHEEISRSVSCSKSPADASMRPSASSPARERCHTEATPTGDMVSPEVIPAGRATSSIATSHSGCPASMRHPSTAKSPLNAPDFGNGTDVRVRE